MTISSASSPPISLSSTLSKSLTHKKARFGGLFSCLFLNFRALPSPASFTPGTRGMVRGSIPLALCQRCSRLGFCGMRSRPLLFALLFALFSGPFSSFPALPLLLFPFTPPRFFPGKRKGPAAKPQALSLFFPFYLNPCVQGDQPSVMLPTMAASISSSIWGFSRLRI